MDRLREGNVRFAVEASSLLYPTSRSPEAAAAFWDGAESTNRRVA